jgi:hypothetical protein
MKYGTKLLAASGLAIAMSTFGSAYALADCATRHFYNHSNVDWVLVMGEGGSCSDGPTGNIPVCKFKPGQYGEIHYKSTFAKDAAGVVVPVAIAAATKNPGALAGAKLPSGNQLTIQSDDPNNKTYPAMKFTIRNGPTTCYLVHDGNTGNVVLNDPAEGDIQTCGRRTVAGKEGNYDCH